MDLRHRLAAIPAGLALAAATLALAPAIATATTPIPEREVVAVTPLEDATTVDAVASGLFDGDRLTVAADGTLRKAGDADFTSADSTRHLAEGVSALADRPTAFDLRDAAFRGQEGSFVTPVKSQNPFGSCWAFGSIAAAESSILSEHGLPYDRTVTADTPKGLDLSEKQLNWFTWMPMPLDGDNGQGGEGFRLGLDPDADSGECYSAGGYFYNATTLFSSLTGPLDESVDPILEYHNAQGDYLDYGDGTADPSPVGDWTVPEAYRDQANFELEESFALPYPASWEPTDDPEIQRYVFNQAGVDAIKDQLLAGRAVGLGFCADLSLPGQPADTDYLNTDTWAQYTYESPREGAEDGAPNHAVCIVGYDDDFSRENFNAAHQPPDDGAFIVKNSWGAVDSSYGNKGDWGIEGTGYFYLSYYDKSYDALEAYDFITPYDDDLAYGTTAEDYEVDLYQYAYLPGDPESTLFDGAVSMANVYEIDGPSVIRDVSTQTYSYDTDVRFDLYLLDDGAAEPTDGILAWSRDEHFPYGGYHRVEVDAPVVVEPGRKVALVCTVQLPDGRYELESNTYGSELGAMVGSAIAEERAWGETVVNEGESFFGTPSRRIEYADGSYAYGGYDWSDYGAKLAQDKDDAQAVVDAAGIGDLIAARDAAYDAYASSAGSDEAGRDALEKAWWKAQSELSEAASAVEGADAAFQVYDNFPLNLTIEAIDPDDPPTATMVDLVRLYNPSTGEHLYTADAHELAVLTGTGWHDEGTGWTAPARSNTAVWRLFNPWSGEHLLTTNATERSALLDAGWRDESVAFHSDNGHGTAIYRLYNPYEKGVNSHFYTANAVERDQCIRAGWRSEGIAWYGL